VAKTGSRRGYDDRFHDGSALISAGDKYFHGRPSATTDTDPNDATKTVSAPYNAQSSSGSNLGPTSKSLVDRVKEDVEELKAENAKPIPVDLVTTSASSLDPEITPAAAALQTLARDFSAPNRASNILRSGPSWISSCATAGYTNK